jgi:hypothetical protein
VDVGGILEQGIDLLHHILSEGEGLRLREIELAVVAGSAVALDGDVLGLPLRSQSPRTHVSGSVNFGDDLDGIEFCHADEAADVVRSVDLLGAVATVVGQLGVRAESDGEGLVVHQVPVQDVQLGQGHGLDQSLDGRHSQEVPRRVNHNTSVLQQGSIAYSHEGDATLLHDLRQRLKGVHVSGVIPEADGHSFSRDLDLIGFRLEVEGGGGSEGGVYILVESEGAVAVAVGVDALEDLA